MWTYWLSGKAGQQFTSGLDHDMRTMHHRLVYAKWKTKVFPVLACPSLLHRVYLGCHGILLPRTNGLPKLTKYFFLQFIPWQLCSHYCEPLTSCYKDDFAQLGWPCRGKYFVTFVKRGEVQKNLPGFENQYPSCWKCQQNPCLLHKNSPTNRAQTWRWSTGQIPVDFEFWRVDFPYFLAILAT